MLALVDLENASYRRWNESLVRQLSFKYLLEELTREPCLLLRYDRVNPYLLNKHGVEGVIVSGNFSDWDLYDEADFDGLAAIYQAGVWPVLGICGGLQRLVLAYGGSVGPMQGDIPTLMADQAPELFDRVEDPENSTPLSELGFTRLKVIEDNPLLENLPAELSMYEYHYWEVKELPDCFTNLARSKSCLIQLIAHVDKPLFGCEFHPEMFNSTNPHGRQMLLNFHQIVKSFQTESFEKFA